MTVALRAEITAEEYAQIRVQALKAGVSTQSFVGSVLRGALTEGEPKAAIGGLVEGTAAVSREETNTASASPSVSVPDIPGVKRASEIEPPAKLDPLTGELHGSGPPPKLYARAGCVKKIPMGERCEGCGAVHQP